MGAYPSKEEAMRASHGHAVSTGIRSPTGAFTNGERPPTRIQDLPSECLVEIMRRVGGDFPIPVRRRGRHDDVAVHHAIHCALVCRRWRALADCGVSILSLRDLRLTEPLARHLARRFRQLSALTIAPLHAGSGEALLILAQLTPQLQRLDLPGGFESSLPVVTQALIRWTSLRRLNLGNRLCAHNNQTAVQSLIQALSTLPSLQSLRFRYENPDLPLVCEALISLTSLTSLQLECCHPPSSSAPHIPPILRELNLHDLLGGGLPECLSAFSNLESLSVDSAEDLTGFPPASLSSLSRLTRLDVINCPRLAALPPTLSSLASLEVFQVRYCPSLSWPPTLGSLPRLRTLVITRCRDLPNALAPLPHLAHLKIDNFQTLPSDIGDLSALRTLELGYGDGVSELPSSLGNLKNLQVLRLQFCPSLSALPPALGKLTSLRELDILNCGNEMESLPDSLGHLTSLEVCKISGLPCLRLLPEGLGGWASLTKLEVSWCDSLKALPEELGRLQALEELEVAGCWSLGSLPKSLGSLTRLQVLRVRACPRLVMLPETVEGLGSLRVLQVWDCDKLEPLPQSLRRLCHQFDIGWL